MSTKTVGLLFAGVILVAALAASKTHAQSEIAPDQFESPNTEPLSQPEAIIQSPAEEVRYDGEFRLRYPLQCRGKTIAPGKYTLSLPADGKTGRVTIASKSESVEIAGVVHTLTSESRRAAVAAVIVGASMVLESCALSSWRCCSLPWILTTTWRT